MFGRLCYFFLAWTVLPLCGGGVAELPSLDWLVHWMVHSATKSVDRNIFDGWYVGESLEFWHHWDFGLPTRSLKNNCGDNCLKEGSESGSQAEMAVFL